MMTDQMRTKDVTNAVPFAEELTDENLESLFGGICGCGWICSFTGECTCSNGFSVCYGCDSLEQL